MKKILIATLLALFIILPVRVNAMEIIIKSQNDPEFRLQVEPNVKILDVKSMIETITGLESFKQRLIYAGKDLKDDKTISDYNIMNESILHLSQKKELNVINCITEEPKVGSKPGNKATLILSDGKDIKLQVDDLEIEWFTYDPNVFVGEILQEDDVFEKDNKYHFQVKDDRFEKIYAQLGNEYYIGSSLMAYINGVFLPEYAYFYVGGVTTVNEVVENLTVGKPFPKKIKFIFEKEDETGELTLNIVEWLELTDQGPKELDSNVLPEAGKKYVPIIGQSDPNYDAYVEYVITTDFRTKRYFNGEKEEYYFAQEPVKVIFDANGGTFKESDKYTIEDWTYEDYDTIIKPTKEGYEFSGYYTEKTGGTKLELILNEAGIDSDMTFYAQWLKLDAGGQGSSSIENPKTSDNIISSIIIGIISVIGLAGSAIYLNKQRA